MQHKKLRDNHASNNNNKIRYWKTNLDNKKTLKQTFKISKDQLTQKKFLKGLNKGVKWSIDIGDLFFFFIHFSLSSWWNDFLLFIRGVEGSCVSFHIQILDIDSSR